MGAISMLALGIWHCDTQGPVKRFISARSYTDRVLSHSLSVFERRPPR